MILGAVSLVVWFIDEDTPQPILMAGGIALAVAALPWLAYPWLVRRLTPGPKGGRQAPL